MINTESRYHSSDRHSHSQSSVSRFSDPQRKEYSRDQERDSRFSSYNRSDRAPQSNHYSSQSQKRDNSTKGANLPHIDWEKQTLVKFEKNLYKEHPTVKARSAAEVEEFRKLKKITVKSKWAPNPITTFEEAQFPPSILEGIKQSGFSEPTTIQAQGWPIAIGGNDCVGIASTGSGKTLAFILPALMQIATQPSLRHGEGPIALVLAPTRELCVQIYEQTIKFTKGAKINVACCYGGADKYPQKMQLWKGSEIVIACPGRLLDFLEMGVTNLKRVTYLVLDEADRMLDMGFEPQIRRILSQIRPDKQTLLWSATWPIEIQRLARDLCRHNGDPIHIVVGSEDLAVNHMIKQNVEVMEERMKKPRLIKLLQATMDGSKTLIFCKTKKGVEHLARGLSMENWPALAIHGDKPQFERDQVMQQFKNGKCPILVATDLAARGLDVKDVKFVINFDFPMDMENYVHRVGRTGRAGANGVSYTFFTHEDGKFTHELIKVLRETKQEIPSELSQMSVKFGYDRRAPKQSYWAPQHSFHSNRPQKIKF